MLLTIAALFIAILAIALLWWFKFYYTYIGQLKYDGPKALPFLGSALEFGDSKTFLPTLRRFVKNHGKVVKVILGAEPILVIADYKMMEFVHSSTKLINKSGMYRFLHNWIERGLLTSTGEKWKSRRRLITPTYHFQILEQFCETFNSVSDILVQKLEAEVDKGSTDIYPFITLCALDIIAETAMGTKINAQMDSESVYVRHVKEMCKIVVDRSFSPIEQFDILYQFTTNYRIEKKALTYLHDYTNSVIQSRRQTLIKSTGNESKEDEFGKKRRVAFLDLLLEATVDGKPLTDNDIREEVDTFMFEGHDTTASGMSFALYAIANHPEVQAKIIEEQKAIFGNDKNRPVTSRDLQDMKYLDLVIKETLRLYPSVPFYAREIHEDIIYDGMVLKKGMSLTLFVFEMHRDPEFFPDPDLFNPERFSPENKQGNYPYSYIPFSAGLRNCIGQKFAIMEMKSTISKVLRNYILEPVVPAHKVELVAETILKSANGVLMKIKKRDWN